jgi:hypothetical protein
MNHKKYETESDLKSQTSQALAEFNKEEMAREQEKLSKEHKKGKKIIPSI